MAIWSQKGCFDAHPSITKHTYRTHTHTLLTHTLYLSLPHCLTITQAHALPITLSWLEACCIQTETVLKVKACYLNSVQGHIQICLPVGRGAAILMSNVFSCVCICLCVCVCVCVPPLPCSLSLSRCFKSKCVPSW